MAFLPIESIFSRSSTVRGPFFFQIGTGTLIFVAGVVRNDCSMSPVVCVWGVCV